MPSLKPKQVCFLLTRFPCLHWNPNSLRSPWQDFHACIGTQQIFVSRWQDFRAIIATQTILYPGDKISMPAFELKQIWFFPVDRVFMHWLTPKQYSQDFHAVIKTQTMVCPADRIYMPSLKPKQSLFLLTWFHCLHWNSKSLGSLLRGFPCLHCNPTSLLFWWQHFHAFIRTQTNCVFLLTRFPCIDWSRTSIDKISMPSLKP